MISHKIYISSGWTCCYPVLPTTVGIGAARKLIPCAGKEICRVCRISIQLMTSMSFGYRAFCGGESVTDYIKPYIFYAIPALKPEYMIFWSQTSGFRYPAAK